jgi:hypothetical protein
MNDQVKYVNEVKVAELTGMALATLRNHRWMGRGIPYIKFGRSVRYSLQSVESFMQERTVEVSTQW